MARRRAALQVARQAQEIAREVARLNRELARVEQLLAAALPVIDQCLGEAEEFDPEVREQLRAGFLALLVLSLEDPVLAAEPWLKQLETLGLPPEAAPELAALEARWVQGLSWMVAALRERLQRLVD